MTEKIIFLKSERDRRRREWQNLRDLKLSRKRELLLQGATINEVRHDKLYRQYRKSQHHVSRVITHLEININKGIASMRKKDGR